MFQLPVVLTLLAQAGIVTRSSCAISAATPSSPSRRWPAVLSPPDPFSMIAMALPTILLYEAVDLGRGAGGEATRGEARRQSVAA